VDTDRDEEAWKKKKQTLISAPVLELHSLIVLSSDADAISRASVVFHLID